MPTYNLNSYDSGTRAWADVHAKKTVPQRWSSIAFDFFDLSSSNLDLLHESSVELWDNLSRAQNALSWPRSAKFEACPTMPCISLVIPPPPPQKKAGIEKITPY